MATIKKSKPISQTIGLMFGGLWGFSAAAAASPDWQLPLTVVAGLVTIGLIFRLWANRAPRSASAVMFGRNAYLIAVVAELLAIYAASILLHRFGWHDYFIQTVGIIVGLHFIGLWVATRSSTFIYICAGMCAVSALAIALPASLQAFHLRDFFTGAGNAVILWLFASMPEKRRSALDAD